MAAGGSPLRVETVDDALAIVRRSDVQAVAVSVRENFIEQALEAVALLRAETDAPLLVLGDPHSGAVVARGLEAGADGFFTQIPPPHLLIEYLRGLREPTAPNAAPDAPVIRVRDLVLDLARCMVALGGEELPVTPTEFRLLVALARRPGRVLSAQDLVREALGYHEAEPRAGDLVKVHIYRLRAKLRPREGDQPYIVSARGFGYMLERRLRPRPGDRTGADFRAPE